MIGKIYCGYYNTKLKHGVFKIGMTEQGVGTRASQIRQNYGGDFTIADYVKLPKDATKPILLFIESYVRLRLQNVNGLTYCYNSLDHFKFEAANHAEMVQKAQNFAKLVKQFALEGYDLAKNFEKTY